MSKIGQTPVTVPASVTVTIADGKISVKGKSGELAYQIPTVITVKNDNGTLIFERANDNKKTRAMHGFFRKLIANAVAGVDTPWTKNLEIVGTGFNVKAQGEELVFKLGFSHPVTVQKIEGIKFAVDGNTKFSVSGIDRQLVGQVAHQIKILKKPDAYKGKGIRYAGEVVKTKPGKKAKAA